MQVGIVVAALGRLKNVVKRMLKSTIPLEPTAGAKTTLFQALEWIAFGVLPLDEDDAAFRSDNANRASVEPAYDREMAKAKKALFRILKKGHIVATAGEMLLAIHAPSRGKGHKFPDPSIHDYLTIKPFMWAFDRISWEKNSLEIDGLEAAFIDGVDYGCRGEKITIEMEDLFRVFPPESGEETLSAFDRPEHIPHYMGLMTKAVKHFGISPDNQPESRKKLARWFLEQDSSLSPRVADYLATFVRSPDKRRGCGNKKGDTKKLK